MTKDRKKIKNRLQEISKERKELQERISSLHAEEYRLWHEDYELEKLEDDNG